MPQAGGGRHIEHMFVPTRSDAYGGAQSFRQCGGRSLGAQVCPCLRPGAQNSRRHLPAGSQLRPEARVEFLAWFDAWADSRVIHRTRRERQPGSPHGVHWRRLTRRGAEVLFTTTAKHRAVLPRKNATAASRKATGEHRERFAGERKEPNCYTSFTGPCGSAHMALTRPPSARGNCCQLSLPGTDRDVRSRRTCS